MPLYWNSGNFKWCPNGQNWKWEKNHKNMSPLKTPFPSKFAWKIPLSWDSFSRDPGPEFPGNGNAKIPGIPGNFPSRDSRPTALCVTIENCLYIKEIYSKLGFLILLQPWPSYDITNVFTLSTSAPPQPRMSFMNAPLFKLKEIPFKAINGMHNSIFASGRLVMAWV